MGLRQTLTFAVLVLVTGLMAGASDANARNVILDRFLGDPYNARPAAGDCRVLVDRYGPEAVWHGEFAGHRRDYNYRNRSYFGSGCFLTERACRIWQFRSLSALNGGLSIATRCHRPVPNWELR